MEHDLNQLPPWELLAKKMIWQQLGDLQGKRILDFGSGEGVTACHYGANNDVVAVEPSEESVAKRWQASPYQQLVGSTEKLTQLESGTFDVILCHNVLEYVPDREEILGQFHRLLKPDGVLSIVKHNRPGRVMQMVVLLNAFDKATDLLDGKDGTAAQFGTIRYYEDEDITRWCGGLKIRKVFGIRTFWDLQQNQDSHSQQPWQEKMLEAETKVSELEPYRSVAFFHHVILRKNSL